MAVVITAIASLDAIPTAALYKNGLSMNVRLPATDATATLKSVSAAASLTSDSPVSTLSTRRRSPSSRPIATALTASGGATTAPSTIAAPPVSPGTTHAPTAPTANVVA